MKNKILILGKGFIGKRLAAELNCRVTSKHISSYKDIQALINSYKPKVLINCIGHTGASNVDDCEKDIDKTLSANTFLPIILAEAAFRNKIKLVHISSGCIYDYDYAKQPPIKEDLKPDFYKLFYSRSKIYSESALNELSKRCNILITRIRIPLDDNPHPKNILNKLIKYKKIIDIPNSITYIPDFIDALKHLLKIDATGIYNIAAKGSLRYPVLLAEYKKYNPAFKYTILPLKKLRLTRTNLILSVKKLEKSGFKVRSINQIIKECIKNYQKY